jgi:arylsulfatase A-like enzyme
MSLTFRRRYPNFLIITVDELRFPPGYEDPELQAWCTQYLRSQTFLRTNAMEYLNHYTGATACSPARATIYTGHYPPLHGVSQTDDIAKRPDDPGIYWLDPNTVPTMGHYFRANGYKTFYKGKWHISEADILYPGSDNSVISYDPTTGDPVDTYTNIYLNGNRLDEFGFDEWVGPDPVGVSPNNTGGISRTTTGGRDVVYSDEIVELIGELEKCNDPFLMVASFVNPHDIVFYGDFTDGLPGLNFTVDPTLPATISAPPTATEDLSTKPSAQASYKTVYNQMLQPISNGNKYRQLYYTFQKYVDDQIYKILQAIKNSRLYNNTIIVFTSDHGDELGAHGLHQKWHNSYQESIHVPLIIHNPLLFSGYKSTTNLTSHVDLIPTLMEMAGLDVQRTINKLSNTHTDAVLPVGKRIFIDFDNNQLNYDYDTTRVNEPIYFWTTDDPSRGLNQVNVVTRQPYTPVTQPAAIEAILTYLSNGTETHLYKYSRYFDPYDSTVANEYEMYDLTVDPYETSNLANPTYATPATDATKTQLDAILVQQRAAKNIKPTDPVNPLPGAIKN